MTDVRRPPGRHARPRGAALPRRVPLGRGDRRRTRSRARPTRTAAAPRSGTPSPHARAASVNGDTGDVAADHYHRYRRGRRADARARPRAYRFSVAWPRVQPAGRGPGQPAGLDFYRRLVDELLERRHRAVADALPLGPAAGARGRGRLAGAGHRVPVRRVRGARATSALGDRVRHWITLNEPWCSAFLGYGCGAHAPGPPATPQQARRAPPTTCCSRTASAVRGIRAAGAGRRRSASCSTSSRVVPATGDARRRRRGAAARRACTTGSSSTRSSAAATRPTCSPTSRRVVDLALRPRRRPRRDLRADRLARRQLLPAVAGRGAGAEPAPRRAGSTWPGDERLEHGPAGAASTPRWAGRSTRPGFERLLDPPGPRVPRRADARHRERRRVRRPASPPTARCTTRPDRVPRPRTSARCTGALDGRAPTCAATSSGRCSTTSSGPRGTHKRFGLVHVDYETQRAHPEGQRPLVPADVIARNGLVDGEDD